MFDVDETYEKILVHLPINPHPALWESVCPICYLTIGPRGKAHHGKYDGRVMTTYPVNMIEMVTGVIYCLSQVFRGEGLQQNKGLAVMRPM